jgi:hypothetical protein
MRLLPLFAALLLTACGKTENMAKSRTEIAPEMAALAAEISPEMAESLAVNERAEPGVGAPQIAYRYARTYRVAPADIAALQGKQIALCDRLGAGNCHVVRQRLAITDGSNDSALVLAVASGKARPLLVALDSAITKGGGDVTAQSTDADNLSGQIVDTEARIRAKQALADRLLTIIRSRAGPIKDVVAAEQAFAEAQGELESARAELALMRRQVAMSVVTLAYDAPAGVGASFGDALGPAWDESAALFGSSLALLLRLLIIVLPWLAVAGGLLLARRRWQAFRLASDKAPHDTTAS